MTKEEFRKLKPRKSILKTTINGIEKEVLLKFFLCHPNNFDGYSLCVTEDFTNPEPDSILPTDYETFSNLCEVVKFE